LIAITHRASSSRPTGSDGKPYLMPFITYPWAVMYRKSTWQQHGYTPPATFDDLLTLAERMKTDSLVPIAFGDRDGWPAMGYFDILDLRLNGYDFHGRLLNGTEKWTDQRSWPSSRSGGPSCLTSSPARSAGPGRRPRRRWSMARQA
jgi:multiple sugar transport system substrate-binding protein